MHVGEKYAYWRRHTRSITEHRDESLAVRLQFITKMREELDAAEAEAQDFEKARFETLLADAEG